VRHWAPRAGGGVAARIEGPVWPAPGLALGQFLKTPVCAVGCAAGLSDRHHMPAHTHTRNDQHMALLADADC
jgi:hypothetical protein